MSEKHLRPSRPRYEWHWAEAWSSATTSTTARCGVGGISSSFSGRLGGPGVALGASDSLYETSNLWCRLASKIRSCWDVHHEVPPSDPGLQHGRIPIFSEIKRKRNIEISFITMILWDYVPRLSIPCHD